MTSWLRNPMLGGSRTQQKEELHQLQAEVDGRDYALQVTEGGGSRQPSKHTRLSRSKIETAG